MIIINKQLFIKLINIFSSKNQEHSYLSWEKPHLSIFFSIKTHVKTLLFRKI